MHCSRFAIVERLLASGFRVAFSGGIGVPVNNAGISSKFAAVAVKRDARAKTPIWQFFSRTSE